MTRPLTASGYDHGNELVDRTAPRWAWDIIDETLSGSRGVDLVDMGRALKAMIDACEAGA